MAARINLLAQRLERLRREDRFDGQCEILGNLEGEFEAGAVLAAFQKAYGLVVHADGICQLLAASSALSAKDGNAVVEAAFGGGLALSVVAHINILLIRNKFVKFRNNRMRF